MGSVPHAGSLLDALEYKESVTWTFFYCTLQVTFICFLSDTLYERQIEVVLVILSTKHGKSLSFQ